MPYTPCRSRSAAWTAPGGVSDTTGVSSIANVTVLASSASAGQAIVVNLDPASVQSWVSNPANNFGLIFYIPNVAPYTSCGPKLQVYPRLVINYTCPDGYGFNEVTGGCDGELKLYKVIFDFTCEIFACENMRACMVCVFYFLFYFIYLFIYFSFFLLKHHPYLSE